jgi:hypothetical protein
MKNKFYCFLLIIFCCVLIVCCNKKDAYQPTAKIADYTNLAVGKFVIYQLDSTITLPFGVGFTVHSYMVKDTVDGVLTDNLNRPGFHIVRFVWDTAAQQWKNSNTFFAVQTDKVFEYTENNLKQVRLASPVGGTVNWQGNSAMGESPFNFVSNDNDYVSWTFSYSNANQPFAVGNLNFDSTVTVVQYDSNNNNQTNSANFISNYSKSYEVYAKGVGKIFQDLFSWEYQTSYVTQNCLLIHCTGNMCDTTKINCKSDETTGVSNDCDSITKAQVSQGVRVVCDTIPGNFSYNGYGVRLSILNHN